MTCTGSRRASSALSNRAELRHRTAAHRDRAVSAGPPDRRAHPAHLLLTHLNRVSAQTRQLGARATKLTERVPHALEQLVVLLDHEARTVCPQILLIREHAQQHVARRRLSGLGESQDRPEHHRHTALHVQGASTPNLAVDQLAAERIVTPALAIRRDHVDVTLEKERRRGTTTGQPHQQIRPCRVLGQDSRLEASSVAEVLDPPHALSLVAGWIGRIEPDQLTQQLDRIVRHGAGPYQPFLVPVQPTGSATHLCIVGSLCRASRGTEDSERWCWRRCWR